MDLRHEKIAKIALRAAGEDGLALAGGYAISAHGMGHRPSGDVDLFMDWQNRNAFPSVLARVVKALESAGYRCAVETQGETFARLTVHSAGPGSIPDKVEISADWRAHPPVVLSIGPVLHPDDAVANKMGALFGRALPRDFLDVDAAVTSGQYTYEQLMRLAEQADAGFDRHMFAQALGALGQITDDAFAQYELSSDQIADLRRRFGEWRQQLTKAR